MTHIKWRLLIPYIIIFLICGFIFVLGKIVWTGAPEWSGFGTKTFWDLLDLLIVPIALAILAIWFNYQSNKNSRELIKEQYQDAAFQKYFDFIFELILERNLSSAEEGNDIVKTIAWQRTVAVSQILGEKRKKILLDFLYNTDMIYNNQNIIRLHNTDFSNIDYSSSFLTNTNLRGVNFENANLKNTSIREGDLNQCNLKYSILDNCDLIGANLKDADLTKASLHNAELMLANLKKATVTDEQLRSVKSLLGAIMPDGSRYDGRYLLQEDLDLAAGFEVDIENQFEITNWCRSARELLSDHLEIDLSISNRHDYI